jgi:hypothetical protein
LPTVQIIIILNLIFIRDILALELQLKGLIGVTDLGILVVLVTRLLKQDLDRLVNGMEPVEL